VDVRQDGGLIVGNPHRMPWEMADTCALDVAERGPATLQEVADLMGLSRERSRQLEALSIKAMRRRAPRG
jgi:hypothetical protein